MSLNMTRMALVIGQGPYQDPQVIVFTAAHSWVVTAPLASGDNTVLKNQNQGLRSNEAFSAICGSANPVSRGRADKTRHPGECTRPMVQPYC